MAVITDELTRKKYIQQIEKIEGLPEAERWREIKSFALKLNPGLAEVDRATIRDIRETKDVQLNDIGSSKSLSTRHLLDMPRYLYDALIAFDRDLDQKLNGDNAELSKRTWHKLARTFPEYAIPRKI